MSEKISGTVQDVVVLVTEEIFTSIFDGKCKNGAMVVRPVRLNPDEFRNVTIHKSEIYRLIMSRVKQALTK